MIRLISDTDKPTLDRVSEAKAIVLDEIDKHWNDPKGTWLRFELKDDDDAKCRMYDRGDTLRRVMRALQNHHIRQGGVSQKRHMIVQYVSGDPGDFVLFVKVGRDC